jgi:N-acetylglucosaminyl-diphospho-decaprenol L-rhamnosyltransferase
MSSLAIVIVSWNTRDLLDRALASIETSMAQSPHQYQVIVVDNASHDQTPEMIRAQHPQVKLIETGENKGFAAGNNVALRALLNSPEAPEYIMLLNPDTEVLGTAIDTLVDFLDAHPDIAAVGPRLRYADGSTQSSRRRFPSRSVFFWESTPLEQYWPNNPWAQAYRYAEQPDEREQAVDWLVGAALMVRHSSIERAGVLDDGFMMYSEELEWQERITKTHPSSSNSIPPIWYLPNAVIMHYEGQSSSQVPAKRYIYFHRSRIRHAQMVYGKTFGMMVRFVIRALFLLELGTEAAKWLIGHKRELRADRVKVYWQVIRSV